MAVEITRTRIVMRSAAASPDQLLAAIIAGGRSSRFGTPKPFALLRGRSLVEWVRDALAPVDTDPIVVANEPRLFEPFGLRVIADDVPGGGPITGIIMALETAAGEGLRGAVCVGSDTPFIPAGLILELAVIWARSPDRAAAAAGPAGIEPLCAIYPVSALGTLRDRRAAGLRSLREAVLDLEPVLLDGDRLARFGDPTSLFLNINTVDDLARADRIATLALG
jgi:molybdopterin-guanine dinucleotide biosynthesis protein A